MQAPSPNIIPAEEFGITPERLNRAAIDVLNKLNDAGHDAFLVGGCLRDLLTNKRPKDFDVATSATPEEVNALFQRSRIIGRRFRIVHVRYGRDIIEVSTFRALTDDATSTSKQHQRTASGLVVRDNVFGTIGEDALRRDFTTNALYYSAADHCLYDFVDSLTAIKEKRLHLIGDPETRYREDPVRMLRAARFAAKLGFAIDPETEAPITELGALLLQISSARLFDEQRKLFLGGYSQAVFQQLLRLGLFDYLFPDAAEQLQRSPKADKWQALFMAAMRNTDRRLAEDKPVTPAFLLAVLLWPAVAALSQQMPAEKAAARVLSQQVTIIAIPKRFTQVMRNMWELQPRLEKRRRPMQLLGHRKFRAAYDFLLLREEVGLLPDNSLGQYWSELQQAHPEGLFNRAAERQQRRNNRRRSRRRS